MENFSTGILLGKPIATASEASDAAYTLEDAFKDRINITVNAVKTMDEYGDVYKLKVKMPFVPKASKNFDDEASAYSKLKKEVIAMADKVTTPVEFQPTNESIVKNIMRTELLKESKAEKELKTIVEDTLDAQIELHDRLLAPILDYKSTIIDSDESALTIEYTGNMLNEIQLRQLLDNNLTGIFAIDDKSVGLVF